MDIDYQAVRSQIPIERVLELLKFRAVEVNGPQLRGPCPIHGSHGANSRSFSVNLRKNAYRCFRCGSAGNQLDLWAAVTNRSLYSAAIKLCQQIGMPAPRIATRPIEAREPEKRNPSGPTAIRARAMS